MAIDMTQFYQVFFEESEEHLAAMETLLLDLAQDVAAACEIPPQSGDLPPNG